MTPEMALAKALASHTIENSASAEDGPDLDSAREKLAWADNLGRELAHTDLEKIALAPGGLISKGLGAVQQGAGKALSAVGSASPTKRGLIGAGVGAAGGALKDPGVDPATGQKRSRLGNIAMGAGIGAGAGLAAGPAARAASGAATSRGLLPSAGGAKNPLSLGAPVPALPTPPPAASIKSTPKASPTPAAQAPMTGESARSTLQGQSMLDRAKQRLGISAVPDNVAQSKAYLRGIGVQASVNPDRVDPEVLHKLMLERMGK